MLVWLPPFLSLSFCFFFSSSNPRHLFSVPFRTLRSLCAPMTIVTFPCLVRPHAVARSLSRPPFRELRRFSHLCVVSWIANAPSLLVASRPVALLCRPALYDAMVPSLSSLSFPSHHLVRPLLAFPRPILFGFLSFSPPRLLPLSRSPSTRALVRPDRLPLPCFVLLVSRHRFHLAARMQATRFAFRCCCVFSDACRPSCNTFGRVAARAEPRGSPWEGACERRAGLRLEVGKCS